MRRPIWTIQLMTGVWAFLNWLLDRNLTTSQIEENQEVEEIWEQWVRGHF